MVEAESGAGKSRLLDELALRTANEGVWVLRGTGRDREARRPYQVLEGVVSAIVEARKPLNR